MGVAALVGALPLGGTLLAQTGGLGTGGLDTVEPVGAYLDGAFPSSAPMSPGSSDWRVVDAFPDLEVDETLVIVPNPSDDRLYVGSAEGVIVSFEDDPAATTAAPFMDLSDRVAVVRHAGFLGMIFHPEFGTAGSPYEKTFYAFYPSHCPLDSARESVDLTACDPDYPRGGASGFFNVYLRLSRFEATWDADTSTWRGDKSSEQPMIHIRLYNASHRGGGMAFGNDGYLYLTIGDQYRYWTAQDIENGFEGATLRLAVDVDEASDGTWTCPDGAHLPRRTYQDISLFPTELSGRLYCIPDDNPWLSATGANFEEQFSIGHRNPHRLAIDPVTGFIWSGEVGQSTREEINVIVKGGNYGWPFREGLVEGPREAPESYLGVLTDPVIDFTRDEAMAIIGGYVYRGTEYPELDGQFIAGDYVTENVWAITLDPITMTATKELLTTFTPGALGTFGQNNDGEIYLGSVGSSLPLQRLERVGEPVDDPASTLSALGVFDDIDTFDLHDGAVPYENIPFWSDGALKRRWIFLPNDGTRDTAEEKIAFSESDNWDFPIGTVIMKHFDLATREGDPDSVRPIETRFLVHGDDRWYGLSYRWRDDGSDADLLTTSAEATFDVELADGTTRSQAWLYPSRGQCLTCHTRGAGVVLGVRTHHLNRDFTYPSTWRTANQLRTWNGLGMFDPALVDTDIDGYLAGAPIEDVTAPLELRARSFLDTNCSGCHRPETGNAARLDARLTVPLDQQNVIWEPSVNDIGLTPYFVYPGVPEASAINHRVGLTGLGGMPPLAKSLPPTYALGVLDAWVARVDPRDHRRIGILFEYYDVGALTRLPDFDALTPTRTGETTSFDLALAEADDNFAFRFQARLDVPEDGDWTFYTRSNDGSQLFIDGALVVDNDGVHAPLEKSGTVTLTKGSHDITVTFFERSGTQLLEVSWMGPGVPKQRISRERLFSNEAVTTTNETPTLTDPGDQTTREGRRVTLALDGDDADGDLLYYDAAGLPEGLVLDHETGVISGRLSGDLIGTTTVTASVSDGPAVAVVTFDWTVEARGENTAPTLDAIADQSGRAGDVVSVATTATDAESDDLIFTGVLPPGVAIDEVTGVVSGRLLVAGTYDCSVTASDGLASATVTFTWEVATNLAPSIVSPGNLFGYRGEDVVVQLEGTDDDDVVLRFDALGLPTGLSIDPATGLITGRLNAAGSFAVTYVTTDGISTDEVTAAWIVDTVTTACPITTAGSTGLLAEACVLASTGSRSVTAAALASTTPPVIEADLYSYGVTLPSVGGLFEGVVQVTPLTTAEVVVHLGTPNIPFRVVDFRGRDVGPQCNTLLDKVSTCSSLFRRQAAFTLQGGKPYRIELGPSDTSRWVRLGLITVPDDGTVIPPRDCTERELETLPSTCTLAAGGATSLTAPAFGAASPPSVTRDVVYGVRLTSGADGNTGVFAFTPLVSGTFVFYLGSPGIPFEVLDGTGERAPLVCTSRFEPETCNLLRRGDAYALLAGETYQLRFGPISPTSWLRFALVRRDGT